MISLRLATRQWLSRPLRPILCSLAIAAAVALIVGVGAGFDSLRGTLARTQLEILGTADVFVRPFLKGLQNRIPQSTVDLLRKRPEIAAANPRLEGHLRILPLSEKGEKSNNTILPYEAVGFDPQSEESLHPKSFAAGTYPASPDQLAVDELAAEELKAHVGDTVTVDGMAGHTRSAVIVGIVNRSAMSPGHKPVVFLPAAAMAKDIGLDSVAYNVIEIQTAADHAGPQQAAYAKKLNQQLGKDFNVTSAETRKNSLERTSQGMDFLIIVLSIVSGLCAALIIATTLSVGVQERLRIFGQLRCIGASRRQLVLILLADAALLAFLGVSLGLLLGYLGSRGLISHFPKIFTRFVLEPRSLILAILNGAIATLIGAAIPAWRISRVTPMQAVSIAGHEAPRRGVWIAGTIGLALLLTQILMWNLFTDRDWRFWSYITVGIPFIFIGYCLLGPAVLLILQRFAAVILGRLLFVRPTLLRQAWSRTPWRAGGMIAALMIGVVIYASVRQRSEGLLASWDFPKVFPDVVLMGPGAPLDEIMKLKKVDGVTAVTGIGVNVVHIEKRVFGSGRVVASGNTRFAAVDVPTFRHMVELEFIQGDPQTAMDRLQKGNAILVSQEFQIARNINVGDTLPLKTRDGPVDFEVAGVVKSSGIEMMQNFFDLSGSFHEEAVSSVIGTLDDGKKYFGLGVVNIALVNMTLNGRTPAKAMEELRDKANGQHPLKNISVFGMNISPTTKSGPGQSGASVLTGRPATNDSPSTSTATAPSTSPEDAPTLWGIVTAAVGQAGNWQATSIVEIKQFVGDFVHRMVNALSTIAIAAMCVASLGVANMVIASMQARSYEFGILRAIGIGRAQLLRMVLAEVTLVSLVAGALGSIAGLHFTFMGTRVDRLLIGYTTPFANWDMLPKMITHVIVGISVTILLGWLAALLPAMRTAFRPQRELLAEGRA